MSGGWEIVEVVELAEQAPPSPIMGPVGPSAVVVDLNAPVTRFADYLAARGVEVQDGEG